MLILGLNAYHGDASACLVRDGKIVAAAEEERFRRIKHWAGFPSEAIRYCLAEGRIELGDVSHIAVNSNPKANLLRRLNYALLKRPSSRLIVDRLRNQGRRLSVEKELECLNERGRINARLHYVEHHLAHLASCFLVSPFREAVTVSIDGFGDFVSTAWGIGRGRKVSIEGRVFFPHSLGIFYEAFTQFLGFPHYGDEYKVMGLAPYGRPSLLSQMQNVIALNTDGSFSLDLSFFRHHSERISFQWDGGAPKSGQLYSDRFSEVFGPPRTPSDTLDARHRDIARSVQDMYEQSFFNLLNALHEEYKVDDLTLAGGCAMNSVANGKVRRMSPFRRLYIQPAAGDAGGAIGAAMHIWHTITTNPPTLSATSRSSALDGDTLSGRTVMDNAYMGTHCSNDMIALILEQRRDELESHSCQAENVTELRELYNLVSDAIAEGLVVGWFQGRMEWGPRALGNRSIVCDPRRSDVKELLNRKIKRRESFRPFAPSILREHVAEWFEEEADVPFMSQVFQVRAEKRHLVPAVTHVDGSGRLQTVHRGTNPIYYDLIETFYRKTGVPMVLNTSFNENEPVVCRPEEALDCFVRTEMDWVVLQNWIVRRSPSFD